MDEIVLFTPLQKDEIKRIIDVSVAETSARLEERNITIALTDKAKDQILEEAYTVQYGARPVKRYIQNHIETKLSRALIAGTIMDGDNVSVDYDGEDYTLNK